MKPSQVEVNAELADRAAEVAASRGETVDAVVERVLKDYARGAVADSIQESGARSSP